MEVEVSVRVSDIDESMLLTDDHKQLWHDPYLLIGISHPSFIIDNEHIEENDSSQDASVVRIPLLSKDTKKVKLKMKDQSIETLSRTIKTLKEKIGDRNNTNPFDQYKLMRLEMGFKSIGLFSHVYRYVSVEDSTGITPSTYNNDSGVSTEAETISKLDSGQTMVTQRVTEDIVTTYYEHTEQVRISKNKSGKNITKQLKCYDVLGKEICTCEFTIHYWSFKSEKHQILFEKLSSEDLYLKKLPKFSQLITGDEKIQMTRIERSSMYRSSTSSYYNMNMKEMKVDTGSVVFKNLNNAISRYQSVYDFICYDYLTNHLDFPYEYSKMVYVFSTYSFHGLSPLSTYLLSNSPINITSYNDTPDDKDNYVNWNKQDQEKPSSSQYWSVKKGEMFFLRLMAYVMTLRQSELFFNKTKSGDGYLGWENWKLLTVNDKLSILMDMISICSGSTMYLSDFSIDKQFVEMKSGDGKKRIRIGTEDFSVTSEGSGDCEDLATYIYSMFLNICKGSEHFALKDIGYLCRFFIPFLCLNCVNAPSMNGMDKDAPNVSGHMIMLLVRKKWFYKNQSESHPMWSNKSMIEEINSLHDLLLKTIGEFDKKYNGHYFQNVPNNGNTLDDLYKWESENGNIDDFSDYDFDIFDSLNKPDAIRNVYIGEGTAYLRQQSLYAIERYDAIGKITKKFSSGGGHNRYYDIFEKNDAFYKQVYIAFSDYFFIHGVNIPWIHFTYENTKIYGVTHSSLITGKPDQDLISNSQKTLLFQLSDETKPLGNVKWTCGMPYDNFNQLYPYITLLSSFAPPMPPHNISFTDENEMMKCFEKMQMCNSMKIEDYVEELKKYENQNELGTLFLLNDEKMDIKSNITTIQSLSKTKQSTLPIEEFRREYDMAHKESIDLMKRLMNSSVCEPESKVDRKQSITHWYTTLNLKELIWQLKSNVFDNVLINEKEMNRPWKNLCYMMVNAPNVANVLRMHTEKPNTDDTLEASTLKYIDEWKLVDGCHVYIFWYYIKNEVLQENLERIFNMK